MTPLNNILKTYFLLPLLILVLASANIYSQDYNLVWSDEFDQESFDDVTWTEWQGTAFNNEAQYYTRRDTNVYIDNGNLYLVGLRENYGGRSWTSGRIKTQDQFEFQYGKVEVRAKLPAGKGMWPAFWMLGANINEIGWPYCGEIDIMENRGHQTNKVSGTIHYSAVDPANSSNSLADRRLIGTEYTLPSPGDFSNSYHLFQLEWTDSEIIWSVDNVEFFRLSKSQIEETTSFYPFDKPFYLILNLAIGGDYLGDQQPDETTPDRNELIVDYIRVYQDTNVQPNVSTGYNQTEEVNSGESMTLNADVSDPDGTVEKVEFYINDELIATDSLAPYQTSWTPPVDGCYELQVKAYDNFGGIGVNDQPVTFVAGTGCTQRSYFEAPISFPGTLQLEYYDYGGQNVSYYDTTPDTNTGNSMGNDFRVSEAVDLFPDPSDTTNHWITDFERGEWLSYQVEVTQTGTYDLALKAIPGTGSGRIDLFLNDEFLTFFPNLTAQEGETFVTVTKSDILLEAGVHTFTLEVILDGGGVQADQLSATFKQSTGTEIVEEQSVPGEIRLVQNYPNPFNPTTQISVDLNQNRELQLDIYDTAGHHIQGLYDGKLSAGTHYFTFDASSLSSGVYYYQLTSGRQVITKKMVFLK